MVLVLLKNWLSGKSKTNDKRSLLPVTDSTERLRRQNSHGSINQQDDFDCESLSASSSGGSSLTLSEGSFVEPRVLSDMVIGLSDGLTVPFALTAGLSSLGDSRLVITGGLAELVSGAISMGLGGYLAAVGESEYYHSQVDKERAAYLSDPDSTVSSLQSVLSEYSLSDNTVSSFVQDMEKSPDQMIHFIMKVDKGLEEPADSRQFTSALTIGLSYFVGGFVPLVPYFFTATVDTGLYISVFVMAVTLFLFGSFKTVISIGTDAAGKAKILGDGVKMMLIGGVAAACAWGLVRVIDQ